MQNWARHAENERDFPTMPASFSVVIPAHNEGLVIDRCLDAFLPDLHPGEAEVVVVGNGCTDDTVPRARRHGVQVLELSHASKSAALNTGDLVLTTFPRIYLDADVVASAGTLRGLAATLDVAEPSVALTRASFDVRGSSRWVRAFYRVYAETPYIRDVCGGCGVYGLNEAGRRLFDQFADVLGDDLFVQRLFSSENTLTAPGEAVVHVPRDLRSLIRVRRRLAAGNRQLAGLPREAAHREIDRRGTGAATGAALVELARTSPRTAAEVALYCTVVMAARLGARGRRGGWERDLSARLPAEATLGPVAEATAPSRAVAYLVSMYPAVSHAFIEREIVALRNRGWSVDTYSVRRCAERDLLTDHMRAEAATTGVILEGSRVRLLRRSLAVAAKYPLPTLRAAHLAASSGPRSLRGKVWQAFYLVEALLLYAVMSAGRARHLHVHFANNAADIARLFTCFANAVDGEAQTGTAARGGRWTWSLAMHGPTEFDDPEGFDLPAKFASADAVAAISGYCADHVRALLPPGVSRPIAVVPMSVDVEKYVARPALPSTDGALKVLFVGRLVPEKRPLDLLEAVSMARSAGVHCELVVIGDGPLRADLVARAGQLGLSEARLLGAVGQEDLPSWYEWCDVLCLPSQAEGLPVVIMEAMASGRPVITTRIAGIPELVTDGHSGVLLEPGDVSSLADALRRYGADPSLRSAMGAAGRQAVVSRHDARHTASMLSDLLLSLSGHEDAHAVPTAKGRVP